METVQRNELPVDYHEMMKTESHHNHWVVMVDNVIRWKENPEVRSVLKQISLNDLTVLFEVLGYDKNSEIYRKLYRDMGCSLSAYWDEFYCEANNYEAGKYQQPK